APDFDEERLSELFAALRTPGRRGRVATLRDVFVGTALGQVEDLRAAHRAGGFDAIVADVMMVGAGLAAEQLGTPWASVSLVPLTMPSDDLAPAGLALHPPSDWVGRARDRLLRRFVPYAPRSIERAYREVRAALGLGPGLPFGEAIYSP
ncbi:hypothetical protein, partial [Escherichia coli]|uniref:hypothetical protein n=1 Tax=Escherichia coli TaxID=562 RepID=UPI001930F788